MTKHLPFVYYIINRKNNTVDNNVKHTVKSFFLELLFPSFCLGCQTEGTLLCQDCKATLDISEHNWCLCSKNPIRLLSNAENGKCYRCKNKILAGLYSALSFKEKFLTKKLIYSFKYKPHIKNLSKSLANIIAEHLLFAKNNAESIWQNSILVPVPMEMSKMKNRGYNQSEELAKQLGIAINVPTLLKNLVKVKETQSQTKLSAKEREVNVTNAFAVKNPALFKGKKVFLVDDVYTTGSTMEECAVVLKGAGAKQVWGIVVAREG